MKDPSARWRSLAKGITWETFSYILTLLICVAYTGNARTSLELTTICLVFKIVFFYTHERIWHQVRWGKSPNV